MIKIIQETWYFSLMINFIEEIRKRKFIKFLIILEFLQSFNNFNFKMVGPQMKQYYGIISFLTKLLNKFRIHLLPQ